MTYITSYVKTKTVLFSLYLPNLLLFPFISLVLFKGLIPLPPFLLCFFISKFFLSLLPYPPSPSFPSSSSYLYLSLPPSFPPSLPLPPSLSLPPSLPLLLTVEEDKFLKAWEELFCFFYRKNALFDERIFVHLCGVSV